MKSSLVCVTVVYLFHLERKHFEGRMWPPCRPASPGASMVTLPLGPPTVLSARKGPPGHSLEAVSAAGRVSLGWPGYVPVPLHADPLFPSDPRPHWLPDGGVWGRVQPEGAEGWASRGDGAVGRHPGHPLRPGPQPADHSVPEGAAEVSARGGEGR